MPNIEADHSFYIGSSHKVCEDYALSWKGTEQGAAIVSDGCSSSENTDIGARLLALSAKKHLQSGRSISNNDDGYFIASNALDIVVCLNLHETVLDATLLGICLKPDSSLDIFSSGDGHIALSQNGKIQIVSLVSEQGHPLYLSYMLNCERMERLKAKLDGVYGTKIVVDFDLNHTVISEAPVLLHDYSFSIDFEKPYTVAVFSDGVESFLDKGENSIPTKEIIEELMGFKSLKDDFVQRRTKAFLRRAKKKGWRHYDDVSMAVISVTP
jgi:hypothetical protein